MRAFNRDMKNGYNKFRQTLNKHHTIRKTANTLSQINNFALPVLGAASAIAPLSAPLFGGIGTALKTSETIAHKLK
jgi:hypothetical protein